MSLLFAEKEMQITLKHRKICWILISVREIEARTVLIYDF